MKRILALLLILITSSFSTAMAAEKNIPYGVLDREKLDIYAPAEAKNAPVIVHVHGGGWRIGNKRLIQEKPKAFNKKGYIFVSVGYPLLPDHPVETQAQSIANAVAWVHNNIKRYGGNPDNLTLTGHSAGAHLITLISTDQRYLSKAEVNPMVIKHVVSIDGAGFDMPWRMKTFEDENERGKWLFTSAFGYNDPERWKALSPVYYVSKDKYIPPTLFLTAASRQTSNDASNAFAAKLKAAGIRSAVAPIANRDHGSINKLMGTKDDETFAKLIEFIE